MELVKGIPRSLRWRWQGHGVISEEPGGESQGPGSLVGCRLWGCTESDTTEVTQQQHIKTGFSMQLDQILKKKKIKVSPLKNLYKNPGFKNTWRRG